MCHCPGLGDEQRDGRDQRNAYIQAMLQFDQNAYLRKNGADRSTLGSDKELPS